MRVALIGCGQIATWHLRALQAIPGVTIAAVCDRDEARAQHIAALTEGATVYTDLDKLLQVEHPDTAHILTPPVTHAALAIQAMEAGCHVLVEKPMAVSLQEADAMMATAQKQGVKLSTNHNYLFNPSIRKARQLVAQGEIGPVVYVHSYYGLSGEAGSYQSSAGRAHWAWDLPGGIFTNFLPHLIALQLAFLGEIETVAGVTYGQAQPAGAPATELTVLVQGGGATGVMCVSLRTKPYAKYVDIFGAQGMIHADLVREVCTVHRNWRLPRMLAKVAFTLEDTLQLTAGTATTTAQVALGKMKNMPGLHALVHDFYASLHQQGDPPVSGTEGRKMVAVMELVWAKGQAQALRLTTPDVQELPTTPQTPAEQAVVKQGIPGKVLVTGAIGFLGSHLVAALARCGVEVVALVRNRSLAPPALARQATLVCGDVRDPATLAAAMQGVTVVYHCAAITTNKAAWADHQATNVFGTETVLQQALQAGVKQVLHASSVVVYGLEQTRQDGIVDETAPYAHNPHHWAYYLRSKLAADQLVSRFGQETGLSVTILRLGILYGPGHGKGIGGGLGQVGPFQLSIGNGQNCLPFTYIDNAVDCLLLAAITPAAGGQIYNVVDQPQVPVRDIVTRCRQITGRQAKVLALPPVLLTSLASLLEWRQGVRAAVVPPKLTRYVVRSAVRNLCYDTSKAREQLGWQPFVSLDEGLARTLAP